MDSSQDTIVFDRAELRYRNEAVLRDICGKIPLQGVHLCEGRNGSGKSTFLRALVGLHPVSKGEIQLHNLPAFKIAYLPQFSAIEKTFPITGREFVLMNAHGQSAKTLDLTEIEHALDLKGSLDKSIGQLSGGQFQRLLIARIHLQDARLIVLDEPFNFLDQKSFEAVVQLILNWASRGKAVILAAHEMNALEVTSRIRIQDGHVDFISTQPLVRNLQKAPSLGFIDHSLSRQ